MRNFKQSIVLLLTFLAACGSNSGGPPGPDGSMGTGTHHHYVINTVHVPTSTPDAQKYGLDVGSATGNTPDGTVDNKLGTALSSLSGAASTNIAVANGGVLVLLDVQATDLTTATGAGFQTFVGASPNPTPCSGPTDTICGRHLDGHGAFDVSSNDPHNGALTGDIVAGVFTAGPGDLVVQFAAGSSTIATVNLINAHVHATGATENGVSSAILAGVVTSTDMDNEVLPAIRDGLLATIAKDCGVGCACKAGSAGAVIESQFGTCTITVAAIKNQSLYAQALAPDVCIEASCSKPDGVSFGVGATAVVGTF